MQLSKEPEIAVLSSGVMTTQETGRVCPRSVKRHADQSSLLVSSVGSEGCEGERAACWDTMLLRGMLYAS